jgi:steroid 5-alpha reductase family enzyme
MLINVQYKGDTSIANFTWGGGVLIVALYTFFTKSTFLPRQIIITSIIAMWAGRLILHIYKRYTGKDPRFITWKWQGIKAFFINLIWMLGQAVMIAVMSYPVLLVNTSQLPGLTVLDACAIVLWIFGFCWEAISDQQLFNFMRNPENKGKVLDTGLWRYSRHPNYFGEIVMWWAVYLIALSVPYGWTSIVAPITITFLLIFVTGIPLLEKAMENNLAYQEYKKKTSVLIPWFAKK